MRGERYPVVAQCFNITRRVYCGSRKLCATRINSSCKDFAPFPYLGQIVYHFHFLKMFCKNNFQTLYEKGLDIFIYQCFITNFFFIFHFLVYVNLFNNVSRGCCCVDLARLFFFFYKVK